MRPPTLGVRHMPRPRLSADLAKILSFRLALVSAPAGSGKTTVMSEWCLALRTGGVDAAWLSLDDFDNEPRRFLFHLVSAIRVVRPDFGGEALDLLPVNPVVPMEDVGTSLVHDFTGKASRIVVFLDDYHGIREKAIHAVVDFLLRYVPPHVQFVIGTRRDPPLSIERLRLRGEMQEIHWEDLLFRVDETRNYLNGVCRARLSEEQVRALRDRTEGWITGLQLAAMALAGREDPDRFLHSFSGTQRNIADYLLEDVFGRQRPTLRRFLMRTSILDRMTAPLCDVVTGRQDSRHLIEALEKGNLFVFGLDDHRAWYRYHPLFAEFLRHRLRAAHPEEVPVLYERASEWFEKNGFPMEAVRYAIEGRRYRRAARLLESAGRELFRKGEFQELRRWMDALPDASVRRSPVLCMLHAWALAYLGEFERTQARIDCAEEAVRNAEKTGDGSLPRAAGPIQAELQVLRSVLGIIRADEPDVPGLHPGIPALFPPEEKVMRSYACITLGFASRVAGYLSVALRHFQEALVVSEAADSSLVNLNARLNIGIANYLMGRMNDAEDCFRKSLAVAGERMWLRSIGAAFLRYGLALVLHEKNRLGEALEELSEAIAFLEAGDAYGFLGVALVERARTQLALGRADLASADLVRARQVAGRHNVLRVSFRADLLETRMAVQAKELGRAMEYLDAAKSAIGGEEFGDRPVLPEKHEYYLVERLGALLASGRFEEAVAEGGKGLRSAVSAGRGRNAVEFLVLQAAAWNGLSDSTKALDRLEEALDLSGREGIVRPFLNAGKAILPLLRQLRSRERVRTAAMAVFTELEDPGVSGERGRRGPSGEAFHRREIQILRLISDGFRNREIAERLFLSEETVKWYLKRLFCKLYVRTRTEAIASARKLGLLA